ncbi:MAG: hypothetical protein QFX40_04770 [Archaeoglobales archaeon]|nr:hypothetical protein [Archaeoglobales archaeon]
MKRNIAIYGKGGIGKSTIASHLAAAWGLEGYSVALVGCDPKRDSTLLLTGNRRVRPILDAVRNGEDIKGCFVKGYAGIICAEVGGPEPGVGCAGRGLLLAFEYIDKLRILDGLDIVIYDVPGDVVCGGFVVPMKRNSEVYVVTSGEYLSLYAANNICKGAKSANAPLGGIILNSKFNFELERKLVDFFANTIGSKVVGEVPYIKILRDCEVKGMTVFQMREEESEIFKDIARRILKNEPSKNIKGLSDEELIAIVDRFYSYASQTQNSQNE